MPDGLVVVARGGDVRLLAGMFVATNGEETLLPCHPALKLKCQRWACGRFAARGTCPWRRRGTFANIRRRVAVDDDALRIADEPHGRHGAAFLAELLGLHAQAFEEVVDEGDAFAIHARGIGFGLRFLEKASASSAFDFVLIHHASSSASQKVKKASISCSAGP
jgi:hypothetical protein